MNSILVLTPRGLFAVRRFSRSSAPLQFVTTSNGDRRLLHLGPRPRFTVAVSCTIKLGGIFKEYTRSSIGSHWMVKPHFSILRTFGHISKRTTFSLSFSPRYYSSEMASAAKHVLNDPATLVVDSLKGLATLNPEVKFDEASRGE